MKEIDDCHLSIEGISNKVVFDLNLGMGSRIRYRRGSRGGDEIGVAKLYTGSVVFGKKTANVGCISGILVA